MAIHNEIGKQGEEEACKLLQKKGWKIQERNWRIGHLEVDIIAVKKDEIAFVEVKTRTSTFGNKMPIEYVDKYKQQHIISAANAYVKFLRTELKPRFDIISILIDSTTKTITNIEHFENAFFPSVRTINRNSFSGRWRWKGR